MNGASHARPVAASPRAETRWLDQLGTARDATELRSRLAARYPAFTRDRLRELAILGAAEEGERLATLCRSYGIAVRAILDDSPTRQGRRIGGETVRPSDELAALPRGLPMVIASHRVLKARDRLDAMGFAQIAPFALLQVLDAERFPPHMFYDGWLEDLAANCATYRALPDLFADEMSRQVLDAVIGYRLSLDASVLRPIVEWELYDPANLLHYTSDEVYVDGGAYDGDSIRLFIDRVHGRFSRVLAFEPDKNTFKRLAANFAEEPRVEPVNAGLHRRRSVLRFDNAGTRGSLLVGEGGIEVPVVGLDEVLGEDRVSFIKMNIEGAELEALEGARAAIRRWAPKLAISVYHRPSDLWQIPHLVREMRGDYQLYLRQHDGGVIETVLYALGGRASAID
jgi:FkbM family methyltransferase